jgi:hypothetical protein
MLARFGIRVLKQAVESISYPGLDLEPVVEFAERDRNGDRFGYVQCEKVIITELDVSARAEAEVDCV